MEGKLCDERYKHHQERLDDHEKRLDGLEKTYRIMEKMDFRIESMETSVKEIKEKIDSNMKEKGKKWDKLIDYLFYAILAFLLGYIAVQFGLK